MRIVLGLVSLLMFLGAGAAVAGSETTVAELQAGAHAGEEVVVTGELVGDYGVRGDGFTWAQLNGDTYAVTPLLEGGEFSGANVGIGIRMPHALAAGLDAPGGYRTRGPLVTVAGRWRFHDPDRGGESYLDVTTLALVEPGRSLSEPVSAGPYLAGLALVALAVALYPRRRRG